MHKTVKLSNIINDCVVLAQQAGNIIRQTHKSNDLKSMFRDKARLALRSISEEAAESQHSALCEQVRKIDAIEQADTLIRQTYLHNLSQLYPGLRLIIQGERPTSGGPYYSNQAFIQPDELLELRNKPALSADLLSKSAVARKG